MIFSTLCFIIKVQVLTFLAGLCIEPNSQGLDAGLKSKVDGFMQMLAEAP